MKNRLLQIGLTTISWMGVLIFSVAIFIYFMNSGVIRSLVPIRTAIPLSLSIGGLMISLKWWHYILSSNSIINKPKAFGVLGIISIVSASIIFGIEQPAHIEQEFSFFNEDTELRGSLYLPDTTTEHPVVVIIHGSMCVPRSLYHNFAEELVGYGIATLSFDKRGTGESGGQDCGSVISNSSKEHLTLLADDVVCSLRALLDHPNIDTSKIGLWAISQGGWLAPMVAEKFQSLKCMAIISGPSVSVGEEQYYSKLTGDSGGDELDSVTRVEINQMVAVKPAYHFDPRPLLWKQSINTLWLHGAKDQSVPVEKCLQVIDSLIAAGKPHEYRVFPNGRHCLVEMTFPIDFSPGSKGVVAEWLVEQFRN